MNNIILNIKTNFDKLIQDDKTIENKVQEFIYGNDDKNLLDLITYPSMNTLRYSHSSYMVDYVIDSFFATDYKFLDERERNIILKMFALTFNFYSKNKFLEDFIRKSLNKNIFYGYLDSLHHKYPEVFSKIIIDICANLSAQISCTNYDVKEEFLRNQFKKTVDIIPLLNNKSLQDEYELKINLIKGFGLNDASSKNNVYLKLNDIGFYSLKYNPILLKLNYFDVYLEKFKKYLPKKSLLSSLFSSNDINDLKNHILNNNSFKDLEPSLCVGILYLIGKEENKYSSLAVSFLSLSNRSTNTIKNISLDFDSPTDFIDFFKKYDAFNPNVVFIMPSRFIFHLEKDSLDVEYLDLIFRSLISLDYNASYLDSLYFRKLSFITHLYHEATQNDDIILAYNKLVKSLILTANENNIKNLSNILNICDTNKAIDISSIKCDIDIDTEPLLDFLDSLKAMNYPKSYFLQNFIHFILNISKIYHKTTNLLKDVLDSEKNNSDMFEVFISRGISKKHILKLGERLIYNRGFSKRYYDYFRLHPSDCTDILSDLESPISIVFIEIFNIYYNEFKSNDYSFAFNALNSFEKSIRQASIDFLKDKDFLYNDLEKFSKEVSLKKPGKDAVSFLLESYEFKNIEDPNSIFDFINEKYNDKITKKLESLSLTSLPKVKIKDSDKFAPLNVINFYLYSFINNIDVSIPTVARRIKNVLDAEDLNILAESVYENWINEKSLAKRKMELIFAVYNSNDAFITKVIKQITFWTENSRSAIAAEATKAIAFHGSDFALLQLDLLSKKHKNKKVKSTAAEYFEVAAEMMNLSVDELSDIVIPSFGFDGYGKRTLSYGEREFDLVLEENFEISIFSEGKKLKSLPPCRSNEDAEIVKNIKKEFSDIKKQLKSLVDFQKIRLSNAIVSERTFDMKTFNKVFINNPVMNIFASKLIWCEISDDNEILTTFRYMGDGTFTDEFVEDFVPNENNKVRLIHPFDLDENSLNTWRENLEDFNITQIVPQISIPFVNPSPKEMESSEYTGFDGITLSYGHVKKLEKLGFQKLSASDGGYSGGLTLNINNDFSAIFVIDGLSIAYYEGYDTLEAKELFFIKRQDSFYIHSQNVNKIKLKDLNSKFLNHALCLIKDNIPEN